MGDEWQKSPGYGPQNPPKNQGANLPPDEQESVDLEILQDKQEPANPQEAPETAESNGSEWMPSSQPFGQENLDKRIEDIKRLVIQGASEATRRFSRVAERANEYWQQANAVPQPR